VALTDTRARAAKPADKDYKLADEKGLFLLVKPTGTKSWRMKYRVGGKEKLYTIGTYPEISLAQAREQRDAARALIASGGDPSAQKQAAKAARVEATGNSFEVIAREFVKVRGKRSETGDARLHRRLEQDLFPYLGSRPIDDITPADLLQTLRRIEGRGAIATAHKAKQAAGQVFRYAIATGRAQRDASADLRGALKPLITTHHSAITEPKDVGGLMAAIYSYQATPVVMAALKLSALLFPRPGELRHLEWVEVNTEERRIELPAHKMKQNQPHIIPLSDQALGILEGLRPITANRGKYVFPGKSATRPLSENAVRSALRTLGYTNEQMTPHGFRAMARTLLEEVHGFPVEWIEQQLAHAVRDANGRAYNRTKHLENRRRMMQTWADYLDTLRLGVDNVVPLRASR
jgi:integrase